MGQDLWQASRLREGDNEPINVLFFISIISLADLYEGAMSAFFFALVLLATSKPNLVPGKAEEYSRIKMAIDFLVDLQRVRKSPSPQENESISRDNQLVIASCLENENLRALSRWKTVSVFFEFLFKIRKYSKQSKMDCGSRENKLAVYSHRENEKVKGFSKWKTVSAFFQFLFKIRKYSKQPKKDCVSRENQLAVYSHRESQKVKTFSRWKTVSAFFEFLYKMKKYCREAKDGVVPSFGLLPSQNCGEREHQLVISSRRKNEKVKAYSRWKTVSAIFEFHYKIKKYCRAKNNDGAPSYGLSIIKNTQKGKNIEGGFDALCKAFTEHYHGRRRDKQLMICYRQEDKRLKAFNRWRAISRLFEFLYRIRKVCHRAEKDHVVSSSRLPIIEDRQKDECLGGVASGDVPEAFSKRDHQLVVSSHQESDSTKALNRWRTVALSFEFLYKMRNSCEEFRKDYESIPYKPPVIKDWQKGKRRGNGSFGAVYEAFTESGFFFALKEVPLDTQDKRCCEKISHAEQEISLLSRFRHENIVRYLGSEKDDANFYIFLELVSQGSISQLYSTYRLSDSQASRYARDILRGLNYLHSQNVIHRDIKGDNVLVDVHGSAKLADFGLAKVTNLNDTKSSKGSSYWMAPEVVNPKNHPYDTSADIWSFGCTVLEMLTRQHPYPNLNPYQAMYRIGKGELPPVPTTLSINAQDFILKCLQVIPKDRPTAAQLLHHSFISDLPSTSSSSSAV